MMNKTFNLLEMHERHGALIITSSAFRLSLSSVFLGAVHRLLQDLTDFACLPFQMLFHIA
jgi:hypothetical protein